MSQPIPEKMSFADQYDAKFPTSQDALREYVREVDIGDLVERIEKFRALDFKRMSRDEIKSSLDELMKFGAPDNLRPSQVLMSHVIPAGVRFYRVRTLDQSNITVPLREMQFECDAWEPPPDKVNIPLQRLNKAGEALLYTSPHPSVAFEETKVSDGNIVALIVYESVEPVHLTVIGMRPSNPSLTREEVTKLAILTNFLRDEFTRDVGGGTEFLYKISEVLAKDYFSIPADIHDGWEYPSIAKKGGVNFCLKPNRARNKLALRGFIVAQAKVVNEDFGFEVLGIAQGFDPAGNFLYHGPGSAAHQMLLRDFHQLK